MEDLGSSVREYVGSNDEYRITRNIDGWTVDAITWALTPAGYRTARANAIAWFADADHLELWLNGCLAYSDAEDAVLVVGILNRAYEGDPLDDDPAPDGVHADEYDFLAGTYK